MCWPYNGPLRGGLLFPRILFTIFSDGRQQASQHRGGGADIANQRGMRSRAVPNNREKQHGPTSKRSDRRSRDFIARSSLRSNIIVIMRIIFLTF